MAYYSKMNINGTEFLIAVNIVGSGAPTNSTEANVGMFYMNDDDGSVYKCVGAGVWEPLVSAEQFATAVENYFVENPIENGKSAYEYAQDGGYEGTEEEFTKKLAENPDWVATKKVLGGDEVYVSQQTLTSGMWSKLQINFQVDIDYDVYFNGEVYVCRARNEDGGIYLGNITLMNSGSTKEHNNEPFCIYWAGAGATSGFFYKSSTVSYPITLKVTDHAYIEYNKMPKGYLPDDIGGGASIDVTAEVGQTIIVKEVDANGKPTKWESADYQPRTHYMETILPETTLSIDPEEGVGFIPQDLALNAEDEVTVIYNGAEYDCTVEAWEDGSKALGNLGAVDESYPNTGEPFVIVCQYFDETNLSWVIAPMDGSSEVKISIKTYVPIPQAYLTNAFPYYIDVVGPETATTDPIYECSLTAGELQLMYNSGRDLKVRLTYPNVANEEAIMYLKAAFTSNIGKSLMFSEIGDKSGSPLWLFFIPQEDGTLKVTSQLSDL